MGDWSDIVLDGILDSSTGEYIGPAVGYPRSMDPDSPDYAGKRKDRKMNPVFGVESYLRRKNIRDIGQVTADYFAHEMGGVEPDHKKRCEQISKDFGSFIKWLEQQKK